MIYIFVSCICLFEVNWEYQYQFQILLYLIISKMIIRSRYLILREIEGEIILKRVFCSARFTVYIIRKIQRNEISYLWNQSSFSDIPYSYIQFDLYGMTIVPPIILPGSHIEKVLAEMNTVRISFCELKLDGFEGGFGFCLLVYNHNV